MYMFYMNWPSQQVKVIEKCLADIQFGGLHSWKYSFDADKLLM